MQHSKGSSDRRHSGGFLPQGFGECGNHTVQLAVQHLVDLLDAALLAEGFVQKVLVHHGFVLELFGNALQPAALRRHPVVHGVDALHGVVDAFFKRQQRLA